MIIRTGEYTDKILFGEGFFLIELHLILVFCIEQTLVLLYVFVTSPFYCFYY